METEATTARRSLHSRRLLPGALACLAAACALSSCTSFYVAPVVPQTSAALPVPRVIAFGDYSAPLDVTFDRTGVDARHGRASTVTVFNLFSYGDASVEAAARQGGIGVVTQIDHEFFNVFGLYVKYTTVVTGRPTP
jgi:hypothetical protein